MSIFMYMYVYMHTHVFICICAQEPSGMATPKSAAPSTRVPCPPVFLLQEDTELAGHYKLLHIEEDCLKVSKSLELPLNPACDYYVKYDENFDTYMLASDSMGVAAWAA